MNTTLTDTERTQRLYWIAALGIGWMIAITYTFLVAPFCMEYCDFMHETILNGTAEPPFRYRLFTPALVSLIPANANVQYILGHMILSPLVFWLIWRWARGVVGDLLAVFGCLYVAVHMLVFFPRYTFGLYNIVEIGLMAVGMIWLRNRGGGIGYAALVAVGTLNRETTGLILLLLVIAHDWRKWTPIGLASAAFGAVYFGLRLALGDPGSSWTVSAVFGNNLTPGRLTISIVTYLALIPAALLTASGWGSAGEADRRRFIIVGIPYAVMALAFGHWDESRLLLPLLLITLPIALAGIMSKQSAATVYRLL